MIDNVMMTVNLPLIISVVFFSCGLLLLLFWRTHASLHYDKKTHLWVFCGIIFFLAIIFGTIVRVQEKRALQSSTLPQGGDFVIDNLQEL